MRKSANWKSAIGRPGAGGLEAERVVGEDGNPLPAAKRPLQKGKIDIFRLQFSSVQYIYF